ncbi:tyrosine-protein phosphatase [Streptomyces sp. JNUCC 63]
MSDTSTQTTAPGHAERAIHFAQIFNVRDLGGLCTSDGRRVRPGRMYRTDDPHLATDADAAALGALGLRTVIDLRTPAEIEQRGTRRWDELGTRRVSRPLWAEVPSLEHAHRYLDPVMTGELYGEMHEANLAAHPELWRAVANASAQCTAVHCASGRDRTGIVVALLLSLLGVRREDILEDYAMSAQGMRRMLDHLEATYPAEVLASWHLDKEAMLLTPPEAIGTFLDRVQRLHGGIEGYAEQIGITDLVPVLRENLLEG